ncbi:MAG: hypothetical protein H6934_12690 [Burkholderiaceae bacterium]|nr:hypothetical protein [Burkholderiaceae bacterium]
MNAHELHEAVERGDDQALLGLYRHHLDDLRKRHLSTSILGYKSLSHAERLPDGPVLLSITGPSFSKLVASGRRQDAKVSAPAKRQPDTVRDLKRLASYLVDIWPLRMRELVAGESARDEHALYAAWVKAVRSGPGQQQRLAEIAAGVYAIYRPSVSFPGRCLLGMLVLYRMPGGVLASYESNRMGERERDPDGDITMLAIDEVYDGYALRKTGNLIVLSFERSSGEQQMAVLALANDDDVKYTHVMDGSYVGIMRVTGVTTRPVVLLRQGDCPQPMADLAALENFLSTDPVAARLQSRLGTLGWQELPDIVRARLASARRNLTNVSPEGGST